MILDILMTFNDARYVDGNCQFKGYLEDYIQTLDRNEENLQVLFRKIVEKYPDARVCVDYKFPINKDVISNQIIGYKDAFKLEGDVLVCPFLIYLSQNNQERLIVLTRNKRSSYLFAKSLYFCLTEPTSIFEEYKNNIITMDSVDVDKTIQIVEEAFSKSAGLLQRRIDQDKYDSYNDLKEDAMAIAEEVRNSAIDFIKPLEDKSSAIKEVVGSWFLLKKLVYVQYMVNKTILETEYQGDVKKQRLQARESSKAIPFIAYSELWRCSGENLPTDKQISETENND